MKIEKLPDFAKPYKKTGYDVRHKGGSYQLFRISSHRVEGKSYPVLTQEYIGTIREDGSLQRKSTPSRHPVTYQEFGLSDFLMRRHHRVLQQSMFNGSPESAKVLIPLAIVLYVFGTVSDTALSCCRLTAGQIDLLRQFRPENLLRVERLSSKILQEQQLLFGDDRIDFELLMRLCVVDSLAATVPAYPAEALEILGKHGVKTWPS